MESNSTVLEFYHSDDSKDSSHISSVSSFKNSMISNPRLIIRENDLPKIDERKENEENHTESMNRNESHDSEQIKAECQIVISMIKDMHSQALALEGFFTDRKTHAKRDNEVERLFLVYQMCDEIRLVVNASLSEKEPPKDERVAKQKFCCNWE